MLWPGSSGPKKGPDFDRCHLATRRQICSVLNVYAVIRTTTLVAVFAVIDFSLTVRHFPALIYLTPSEVVRQMPTSLLALKFIPFRYVRVSTIMAQN
jgi:hypothetical protein